ncbi:MAG: PDZ domain-containing protein, partial [Planctomycetota bacterium]
MNHQKHHVKGAHRMVGSIALLLVVLALIFNVAFYAYARPGGILTALGPVADVREKLLSAYVEQPDDDVLIEAAIRGMVESLDDRHTVYMNQEELDSFNSHVRGTFSGIGAEIDIHNNRLRIVAPLQDSPAWQSGVMAGDIVLRIEGEDTEGITILQAQKKLLGEPGTQVTITVRHRSGEEKTITITRDTIKVASVRGYRRIPGNG